MNLRKPFHSGTFYPSHPSVLVEFVLQLYTAYFDSCKKISGDGIRVLVSPHAGYIYSGGIAACGFHLLANNPSIKRLLVIGPSHYEGFQGFALSGDDGFESPLGVLKIDQQLNRQIGKNEKAGFQISEQVHLQEHSLEVQIPLIQIFLKIKSFVPILVGYKADVEYLGELIAKLLEENEDLGVVISSDLSHFLSYKGAMEKDATTIAKIEAGNWRALDGECACGYQGIQAGIIAGEKLGLGFRSLNYINSGDITSEKDRVVGYSSFVLI
ncbi:MAG: AmmeMemoRadiSam system protein B [Candidatus Absconditabacteria bacterium]